jgi:hypothetical protein
MRFEDSPHEIKDLVAEIDGQPAQAILIAASEKLGINWKEMPANKVYSFIMRQVAADGTQGDLHNARSRLMSLVNGARDNLRGKDKKGSLWSKPLERPISARPNFTREASENKRKFEFAAILHDIMIGFKK